MDQKRYLNKTLKGITFHHFMDLSPKLNIDILGYKAILNRYKKIKRSFFILPYHYRLKMNVNYKRNNRKLTNLWKMDRSLLNEK